MTGRRQIGPRIALVFEYATLNGGEQSILAVVDWLRDSGQQKFEFVAIAPSDGRIADALRKRSIPIFEWSMRESDGTRRSNENIDTLFCQAIESLQPQLVHANSLAMGRLTGRLSAQLKIPTTTHLRDIIKLSSASINDLNRNHLLVAVSEATGTFHAMQGIDRTRLRVIRNGIDLSLFRPRLATGRLHAELGLPFQHPAAANIPDAFSSSTSASQQVRLIATIGQIGLRKGQDVLATAAPAIIAQIPNAHFLLIGERTSQKPESIEFEKAIRESFENKHLSDHLHFLGHRDDIPQLLNEIDLLVHPANQEPFGRVLLEAAASGVPVVATDVGGTPEIVVDRNTGILVPAKNPHAMAFAVIELLGDNGLAGHFRTAARERAVQKFRINACATKLADLWSEALNKQLN